MPWFWWFLLISDLIIPITMLIVGGIMRTHSPKKINYVLGYRTSRSMKNMDTWKFAHEHCGKVWFRVGLIMTILSIPVHIPFYHRNEDTLSLVSLVLVTVQLVVLIASVFPTEAALKRTFRDDGTRK